MGWDGELGFRRKDVACKAWPAREGEGPAVLAYHIEFTADVMTLRDDGRPGQIKDLLPPVRLHRMRTRVQSDHFACYVEESMKG